jgi:hypothetical protein
MAPDTFASQQIDGFFGPEQSLDNKLLSFSFQTSKMEDKPEMPRHTTLQRL